MKRVNILILTLFLMLVPAMPAFATTKINSASVSIKESKAESGEIYEAEPYVGSSTYEITNCEVSKDFSNWKPGSKITFSITLEPKEGYKFDTAKISKVSVSNGEVASSTIKGSKITVKINYVPKVTLSEPANIYFEDEYLAVWDKVEFCKMYEVQIMKENDDGVFKSYKTVKVEKPQIDMSSYATDGYALTFRVRAMAKDSEQSKYLKSSGWVSADDQVLTGDNTSYGTFSGSGDNITFKTEDGTASGWQKINDSWYYFDPENKNKARVSSWKKIDGKWFYFNEYGIMGTGWVLLDNYWYYLDPLTGGTTGSLVTGWLSAGPNGPWYYLQEGTSGPLPEGAMYAERLSPDGTYYLSANGTLN